MFDPTPETALHEMEAAATNFVAYDIGSAENRDRHAADSSS